MAKKLVTENDLLSGVGGGFGNIAQMGAGRPVRDNPFRETRSQESAVPAPTPQPAPAIEERVEEPSPPSPQASPVAKTVTLPRAAATMPAREVPPQPAATPTSRAGVKPRRGQNGRKTATYTEKMSTFLTPEMRDDLEMVARLLQRNRLVKGESITVHTLIRSGIRVMTDLLQFTDADVVSSEEELYALVKRKLGSS